MLVALLLKQSTKRFGSSTCRDTGVKDYPLAYSKENKDWTLNINLRRTKMSPSSLVYLEWLRSYT